MAPARAVGIDAFGAHAPGAAEDDAGKANNAKPLSTIASLRNAFARTAVRTRFITLPGPQYPATIYHVFNTGSIDRSRGCIYSIFLQIDRFCRGRVFAPYARRRSEQPLVSVVQEAYVAGVSTRKVDQVVEC
jgi:hypothetical protein